jgi:hypothetical protein
MGEMYLQTVYYTSPPKIMSWLKTTLLFFIATPSEDQATVGENAL